MQCPIARTRGSAPKQCANMAIAEDKSPTFKIVLRGLSGSICFQVWNINIKPFEWVLSHWSSLCQLNLEPTRPSVRVCCKAPTDLVMISVIEAMHTCFYYNNQLDDGGKTRVTSEDNRSIWRHNRRLRDVLGTPEASKCHYWQLYIRYDCSESVNVPLTPSTAIILKIMRVWFTLWYEHKYHTQVPDNFEWVPYVPCYGSNTQKNHWRGAKQLTLPGLLSKAFCWDPFFFQEYKKSDIWYIAKDSKI